MIQTDSNLRLPNEFLESIPPPASADAAPAPLLKAVNEQMETRHPVLLSTEPGSYRIPVTTALFLYRRTPKDHRETALAALGTPRSPNFGQLLAAVARDAYDQQDWPLLGRLAWHLEAASGSCTQGAWDELDDTAVELSSTNVSTKWKVRPGKLQSAFTRILDYPKGRLDARAYVSLALGYFSSISADFVFPADWWLGTSGSKRTSESNQWAILRLLSRRNASAWHDVPDAFERAGRLKHPFLQSLISNLQRQNSPRPSRIVPLTNPFRKLAGPVGEEPARGKLGRIMRKVTGRASRAEPKHAGRAPIDATD